VHVLDEHLGLEAALGARQIEEHRVLIRRAASQRFAVDRPVEMDRAIAAADRPVVGLEVADLDERQPARQIFPDERLAVAIEHPIGLGHLVQHDHRLGRPGRRQPLLHEFHVE
jgi:hypothetical protein